MSQANASAIKRRAFNGQNPPSTNPSATNGASPVPSALTLPQVISVIDKRLVNLESFVNESKTREIEGSLQGSNSAETSAFTTEIVEEFNHRFEVLADEIGNMKDVIMKLQAYTMEVNKTLFEERINIFSDLGQQRSKLSILEDASLSAKSVSESTFDTNMVSADLQAFIKGGREMETRESCGNLSNIEMQHNIA